jgi:hypothetical protein
MKKHTSCLGESSVRPAEFISENVRIIIIQHVDEAIKISRRSVAGSTKNSTRCHAWGMSAKVYVEQEMTSASKSDPVRYKKISIELRLPFVAVLDGNAA